jgi:hypothetical protein
MAASLWREHILPFFLLAALLALATLAGDFMLHQFDLVWVGRYMGIPGILLIAMSFVYSLRKRGRIRWGSPRAHLLFHQFTAWLGSLLVLIHAGVHFNAVLPWLATIAMGINVLSGLVGKFLLGQSRQHLEEERAQYRQRGLSEAEVEQAVLWDAVAVDAMTRWRKVHIPIFIVFAVLSLGHIFSIFLFWGWS